MTAPVLAFDMETIPDAESMRARRGFSESVSDAEVVEMDARLRRQEKGGDFPPPHLHKIAVISCVLRNFDAQEGVSLPLKIFSLSPPEYEEAEAVRMFFRVMEKYTPRLASWNGGGFDLPVLHWRAMKYGIAAPRYWQMHGADDDGDKFRWNNYTSRYHERHSDVMDALAMYQPRGFVGLDAAARLCGLPGKTGIGGANVWDAWRAGDTESICKYCEADALLTYLLFARFLHFRGALPDLAAEEKLVRESLDETQWAEFLAQWRGD
ncbi:MAG: 3'-5' exonuclease [Gammaproteobacteria bacterium]